MACILVRVKDDVNQSYEDMSGLSEGRGNMAGAKGSGSLTW